MRSLPAILTVLLCATGASAQSGGGFPTLEATLTVPPFTSEEVEFFGTTLAMDGDHAAASGAQQNRPGSGVVHALKRSQGRWVVSQEIAPLGGEEVHFGADIALVGDLLVIGAPGREYDSSSPPGAVYVYALTEAGWTLSDVLVAPPPVGLDQFGASIDFDGERLLVGAPYRQTDRGSGAAYVYERRGGAWTLSDTLTSPFGVSAYFGGSVALDGPNAVVTDVDPDFTRGNVYRLGGGNWTWTGDLMGATADLLRRDAPMSLDGNRLAIGSPRSTGGDGAVVILEIAGGVWVRKAVLLGDSGLRNRLGTSLELDGDRLAAGSPTISEGRAQVFAFDGTNWLRESVLLPPPDGAYPLTDFGTSIALDGNHILVGAPWTSVDELSRAGTVVAFEAGPDEWIRTLSVPVGYPQSGVRFGADVALWGSRVAVGAPRANGGRGSAHVYTVTTDGAVLESRLSETNALGYGEAVALGSDQLMVGAPDQFSLTGYVFVYSLGPDGWTLTQTLSGPGSYGAAVALDGDRALIGAAGAFGTPSGQAFLYERAGGVWGLIATLQPEIPEDVPGGRQTFGASVALDGARAVVGAPGAVVDSVAIGVAYVFESDGVDWEAVTTLTAGGPDGDFGLVVDADGGRVLAARLGPGSGTGTAYVFEGSAWVPTTALAGPSWTFGADVALDGNRIVVGATSEDDQRGYAYVYGSNGYGWTLTATVEGPPGNVEFGGSVAVDGRRFASGAPRSAVDASGSVYVYRDATTVLGDDGPTSDSARLTAPRPNPATGTARLTLSLSQPERVVATVYDALGRSVQTLLDGTTVSGDVTLTVGAGRLAPGLYVVRVVGETFAESARLVVVR